VHAAVDVGILSPIIVVDSIDDARRLLAGRAVVEINQRLAMDFLAEDGKILAHSGDIEFDWRTTLSVLL